MSTELTKSGLNVNISSMPKALMESIVNLIYPPLCVVCNKLNTNKENYDYICDDCYYSIKRHIPPFCRKCGRGLQDIKSITKGVCASCLNRKYYFQQAWSLCIYEGVIKELIHKFKYNQKIQYKEIFKKLLEEFLGTYDILRDIDLIIPIPLHPTRFREREYNQSFILASIVSEIIKKPLGVDILLRIKNTKSQVDLEETSRIKNIMGCFTVKNSSKINHKSILLIDDVLTTGITLSEAARVIREFEPAKISVLTLAS